VTDQPLTTFEIGDLRLPSFVGGWAARAQGVVRQFADRIPEPSATGLLDDREVRQWIDASIRVAERVVPGELAYLAATAAALDTSLEHVFAAQHRSLFGRTLVVVPDHDGCSVGAARGPGGAAWVVKNRDNHPDIRRRHIVTHHVDPAWGGHAVVATSSAGGPMAASGGINTRGFCAVTTAIVVDRPPPGVHRTLLVGEMLARCTTVDEALELIGGTPQLGGTITMGDASGAVATVELEPDAVLIERAGARPWVARTNHGCSRSVGDGQEVASPEHRANSAARLFRMQDTMSRATRVDQDWETIEQWVLGRMTAHDGEHPSCRHDGKATTIATTLFACDPPMVLTSDGPGCEGRWGRWVHTPAAP
jgi:isopenicillin-N N-acyltransferase like protein